MYVAGGTEVINQFPSVASSVVFITSLHADLRGRCGWSNESASIRCAPLSFSSPVYMQIYVAGAAEVIYQPPSVASSKLRYQHGISHLVIHKSVSSRRRTRHLVLHPSVLEFISFRLSLIIVKCVVPESFCFSFSSSTCQVFCVHDNVIHTSVSLCNALLQRH